MICVVIRGPSFQEAYEQIQAAQKDADLIELRLDLFASRDFSQLKALRESCSIPLIFTLRSQDQGGQYTKTESQRLEDIQHLLALQPDYIDLEHHCSVAFIQQVITHHPKIRIILSYHNFHSTPVNLDEIYQTIRENPAFFYKLAFQAHTILDTLRLLAWKKSLSDDKLILISMGSHGSISRILGPIFQSPIIYASLNEQESQNGQLTISTLLNTYNFRSLKPTTSIYGLIGDPVSQSISHETHNHVFKINQWEAVYVKVVVRSEEIEAFLTLAKQLSFQGLSVTMPLKEKILPYLDVIEPTAKTIRAVNTLIFDQGKIFGYNTDGIGALTAIEDYISVQGKQIVLLGAGGAARAIAYEAAQRGAKLTILNRDKLKAHQLAEEFGANSSSLDELSFYTQQGYNVLINCTASEMPIEEDAILSSAIVMDIKTKPLNTEFLKAAQLKGCPTIPGYKMFIEQALIQFNLWFNRSSKTQMNRDIINSYISFSLR